MFYSKLIKDQVALFYITLDYKEWSIVLPNIIGKGPVPYIRERWLTCNIQNQVKYKLKCEQVDLIFYLSEPFNFDSNWHIKIKIPTFILET